MHSGTVSISYFMFSSSKLRDYFEIATNESQQQIVFSSPLNIISNRENIVSIFADQCLYLNSLNLTSNILSAYNTAIVRLLRHLIIYHVCLILRANGIRKNFSSNNIRSLYWRRSMPLIRNNEWKKMEPIKLAIVIHRFSYMIAYFCIT